MSDLCQMSYEDFGKLRFLDFFPPKDSYFNDDVGGTTCGIGLGAVDGYGFTGFASPVGQIGKTAEISLNFIKDCPESEGNAFLRHLGLRLRRGMSLAEIESLLGKPTDTENENSRQYVLGSKWPYCLGLGIDEDHGLQKVWICRKDLADQEAKFLSER
jgi:hypothetical protein